MNQFKNIKDVHQYFERKGSKFLGLVGKKGKTIVVKELSQLSLQMDVYWQCANNSSHICSCKFRSILNNKKDQLNCQSCAISKSRSTKSYETFVEDIEKEGWKMRSEKSEYKNTKSKMEMICNRGHDTSISYAHWSRGERSCRKCCSSKQRGYTIEEVRKIFKERGCKLLENEYINNHVNMRYICKCKREKQVALNNFLRNKSGCQDCTRRFTPEMIFSLFDQTESKLIFASDRKEIIERIHLGKSDVIEGVNKEPPTPEKVTFHEWPEFVLNSTWLLYICDCGDRSYTTWKAFKKGVRCKECTIKKVQNTCKKIYGVKNPFESAEIQERAILTRLEKYGVKYPMEKREFVEKAKETNIRNHGGIHNSQIPEQKEARDRAYEEKYGAPFGFVEEHNEKGRAKTRELLGVDYPFQSEQIHNKMFQKYGNKCYVNSEEGKAHMLKKYGAENAMHCPELFEKSIHAAFRTKVFKFPSGNSVFVQGYEPFALRNLLNAGVKEEDICVGRKFIPTIRYKYDGKTKVYYPDIYIKSKDLLIEVKSTWTYNKDLEKNEAKFKAARSKHNFEMWMFDSKGNRVVN